MIDVFFIGDTHFGHTKILQYENIARPFSSIEEHDEELIKRWNSVVKPKDKVFHLGDFCFGKDNLCIAARLNGNKTLIMGNHDVYKSIDYLNYFERLCGAWFYKTFLLTHIPAHKQHARALINIHGHLHSSLLDDPYYVNVSAERINLTPISLEELNVLAYKQNR